LIANILGLDPGLASSGWAVLEWDTGTNTVRTTKNYGVIRTKKWADSYKEIEIPKRERIDYIGCEIQKVVAETVPQAIVMEDFVYFGNKGKTTSDMPALIENIRMLGRMMGYEVQIYSNGEWKKLLLRNHQASKEQIQHYIHNKLKLDKTYWDALDKGGHIRDAMALALTYYVSRTTESKPKSNKKSNLTIKWV
jgi:Holliday junction resolvasome RuvABC endonuclease subunit